MIIGTSSGVANFAFKRFLHDLVSWVCVCLTLHDNTDYVTVIHLAINVFHNLIHDSLSIPCHGLTEFDLALSVQGYLTFNFDKQNQTI